MKTKCLSVFLLIGVLFLLGACSNKKEFWFTLNPDRNSYTVSGYLGDETSIVIPNMHKGHYVTNIGRKAFYGESELTGIIIPDSVTSIEGFAFYGTYALRSIIIPEGVTSIGSGAFAFASVLRSIIIPKGVTSMGTGVFLSAFELTIYAETQSRPVGWESDWNSGNRPVIWGYIEEII